jgi:hypothetical protein
LPLFKSGGGLSGAGYYYNMEFIGFNNATTTCGSTQYAIKPYLFPDYTPFATFIRPLFTDLKREALTFIENPPQGWANPTDCVEFTCTGPYNVVMKLDTPRYGGDSLPSGLPFSTF